ncbi:MAG: bifunctional 5,10-methylenetetrahydrofolate dehydrogenase/5,10-methenyltetrahydrofolate cyclohydrolase [Bradymonadales bacterium]|nr:bifunctional 5,10-methylenetetrahydrofolate dehydrogenase/5,10-methenyltetrahydrofolate cyclohydrolase [Bradymonadales bacterium]
METQLVPGKQIAASLLDDLSARASTLIDQGIQPLLAFLVVGQDPSTLSYLRGVQKAADQARIQLLRVELAVDADQARLECALLELANDRAVHGIILQRPLPVGLDAVQASHCIPLAKDLDCTSPESLGLLFLGKARHLPCTPAAVLEILHRAGVPTAGRHAVIIGRSPVVGRPLAHLLSEKGEGGDATVTLCHSRTPDIGKYTRQADILVCAAGSPGLVRGDMIRPGTAVVDVSTNSIADPSTRSGFRLVGDLVAEEAMGRAALITPVPGGVGPVTVAMLLKNAVVAAQQVAESPVAKMADTP